MKRFLVTLANLNFMGQSCLVANCYSKSKNNKHETLENLNPNENLPNLSYHLNQFNYLEFKKLHRDLKFDEYEILETNFSEETQIPCDAQFEILSAKELNPIILCEFEDAFENDTENEICHTVTNHKGNFYKSKYNKLILNKTLDWAQSFNLKGLNLEGDNWFCVNDSVTHLSDSSYINWEFGGLKILVSPYETGVFRLKFGFKIYENYGFVKIKLNPSTTFVCTMKGKNNQELIELRYSVKDLILESKSDNNYYNILSDINSVLFLEDEEIYFNLPSYLITIGDIYYNSSLEIERF